MVTYTGKPLMTQEDLHSLTLRMRHLIEQLNDLNRVQDAATRRALLRECLLLLGKVDSQIKEIMT